MIGRLTQTDWRSSLPARLIEIGLCASFIIFFNWNHPPASLLLLGIAAVLAWFRLEIAIALLPLTLPYYLDIKPLRASGSPAFSLSELGLLICLGVALLRNVFFSAERQATWQWIRNLWQQTHPILLPAALLLVGASLALLNSPDLHVGLRGYREDIIEPLLYLFLILRYLGTRADLVRTVVALILSALFVASMGIIQGAFFRITYQVNATSFRVLGPYGSGNNLALFLDRALPILLALAFMHLLQRPATPETFSTPVWRDPLRWLCVLAIIPMLWALYWTDSRGGEVAIGVVVLMLFFFEVRQWIALAVVVGLGAVGAWLFRTRLLSFFNEGHQGTISERFLYWKAAVLMIRDHVFLGTGPNSFGILYNPDAPAFPHSSASYALKALDGQPFPTTFDPGTAHPHNMILDFWISTGLLGLAALFWLLGAFAVLLMRLYRLCAPLRQGDLLQRLLLGLTGSMIAMVVHGMVDNSYFLPDLSMIFWLTIGMLLIIRGIAIQEQSLTIKTDLHRLAAIGQSNKPASTQNEQPITEALTDTPGMSAIE